MTSERLTGEAAFHGGTLPELVSFDLAEMFGLLWRRKGLLLLCGVAGAVLGFAIAVNMAPKYRAQGDLVVRSAALVSPDTDRSFDSDVVNDAVVTTEQQVLTSQGLLRRVAADVVIPQELLDHRGLLQRLEDAAPRVAGIAGPEAAARTRAFLERVLPQPPVQAGGELDQRVHFISDALTIIQTKSSSVLSVQATTADPALSAEIVNRLLDVYMQERSAEQDRVARQIEAALRERLRQTRLQIAAGEDDLVRLLQQPGAIEDSEVPSLMRDMTLLGQQLTQAQTDLARRESDYNSALAAMRNGGIGGQPDAASGTSAELRRQLAELMQNLARTSADYGPSYPARQALQRQVSALQGQIAAESSRGLEQRRSDVASARATVAALQAQMDARRQSRQSQSSTTIGLQRQREAVASLWRISDTLETRLIDLAAHPSNPNARVLTQAVPPLQPAFPNKALIAAVGFVLALVVTIAALLIGGHRRRLRPMAVQIAAQLNAPLLGGLPQMVGVRAGQRRLLGSALGGVSGDGLSETLHGVALELEDAVMHGKIGCLMVTSGHVGEGKTTVATALARALATMSMRVLLIDLDLRYPGAERVFQLSAPLALEDAVQRIGPKNVLQIKRDRHSGLHLLTPFANGTAEPMVQLRSAALRETVALARGCYDLVMFDTPAVLAVPDALEVAAHADAIVLVMELGRTSDAESAELSRRLSRTRKPVCGVIVTKVDPGDAGSGAYSGYMRHRPAGRGASFGRRDSSVLAQAVEP